MADLVFVLIGLVFFAASVAFVRGCDRLIGPDPDDAVEPASADELDDAFEIRGSR